mmetsp:Transcript_11324/g.42451  ORF Transcript_11324/g.42451 Transcript_11324/m.42451 type:complete len:557 (-) Transcript_11324:162-1832(-)
MSHHQATADAFTLDTASQLTSTSDNLSQLGAPIGITATNHPTNHASGNFSPFAPTRRLSDSSDATSLAYALMDEDASTHNLSVSNLLSDTGVSPATGRSHRRQKHSLMDELAKYHAKVGRKTGKRTRKRASYVKSAATNAARHKRRHYLQKHSRGNTNELISDRSHHHNDGGGSSIAGDALSEYSMEWDSGGTGARRDMDVLSFAARSRKRRHNTQNMADTNQNIHTSSSPIKPKRTRRKKKGTLQEKHEAFQSTLPEILIDSNCNIRFHTQVGRRDFFEHQHVLKTVMNDLDYDWGRTKDYLHYHIKSADINRAEKRDFQLANTLPWANVGVGERGDVSKDVIRSEARVFSTDYKKMVGREPTVVSPLKKVLQEQQQTLGPGSYDANDRVVKGKVDVGMVEFSRSCGRDEVPIAVRSDGMHLDSGQYQIDRGLPLLSTTRNKLPEVQFGTAKRSKLVLQTGLPVSHDLVYDAKKPKAHLPSFQLSKKSVHSESESVDKYMNTATQIVNNLNGNIRRVKRLKKPMPYVKRLQRKLDWMEQMYFDMGVKSTPFQLVE